MCKFGDWVRPPTPYSNERSECGMWAIAGIVVAGGLIAFTEVPYLVSNRLIKELVLFSVILFFGEIVGILQSLRFRLPNPLDLITAIYKPISDILFGMLK